MRTSALAVVVALASCHAGGDRPQAGASASEAASSEAAASTSSSSGEVGGPGATGTPTTSGPGGETASAATSSSEGGETGAPSCGQLAEAEGWPAARCEWNGNAACDGHGPPTADCDHCCADTTCAEVQAERGWQASLCERGDGACGGAGTPTIDCDACCSGPSCGDLAQASGWGDAALCEHDDGICAGTGAPTWDCSLCCDGAALPVTGGFGYPVGDLTSYPAGGWSIGQVMAHYLDVYGGRHLAHDVNHPDGGPATVDAPVHAVADGQVRYAGPNGSSYVHVVLIEHAAEDGGGEVVCSFYGHINAPVVATGEAVARGQVIASVRDWSAIQQGGSVDNTHLHYAILRESLCDASAAAGGALVCGYDAGGPNGVQDLADEPYAYQPVADVCGDSQYGEVFLSPTQFIEANHF